VPGGGGRRERNNKRRSAGPQEFSSKGQRALLHSMETTLTHGLCFRQRDNRPRGASGFVERGGGQFPEHDVVRVLVDCMYPLGIGMGHGPTCAS